MVERQELPRVHIRDPVAQRAERAALRIKKVIVPIPAILSRTQAPRRYSPSSSFSGSALSSIVRLPRLTVSAAASSPFSARS